MLRIDVDCFGCSLTAHLAMTKKGGDCHGLQASLAMTREKREWLLAMTHEEGKVLQ